MPEYSPSFIKVDPVTGLTFYDFDGHIHARGVDFTSLSQSSPQQSITWTNEDGTQVAQIVAGSLGSERVVSLKGGRWDGVGGATGITCDTTASDSTTQVLVNAHPPSNPPGGFTRTLLDSLGMSDWCLGSCGVANSVPAGGSVVIAHNVAGATPTAILVTTFFNGGSPSISWVVQSVNAANFTLVNPSGVQSSAFWLAVIKTKMSP